jgi:hypothetical protein
LGGAPGPHWQPCGNAYQEGDALASAPTCTCGTFAIGICTACSQPTCGIHSSLVSGARVCGSCQRAAASQAAQAAAENTRRRVDEAAASLGARANLSDIAAVVTEYVDHDVFQDRQWSTTLRDRWRHLVVSGQLGAPTQDLVAAHGVWRHSRKDTLLSLTPISRTPAWLAKDAGVYHVTEGADFARTVHVPMDVWVDAEGERYVRENADRHHEVGHDNHFSYEFASHDSRTSMPYHRLKRGQKTEKDIGEHLFAVATGRNPQTGMYKWGSLTTLGWKETVLLTTETRRSGGQRFYQALERVICALASTPLPEPTAWDGY